MEKKSLYNDKKNQMNILITGSAGFIGFHLALKLLKNKYTIIGLDNLNSYYSKDFKKHRISILNKKKIFFLKKSI